MLKKVKIKEVEVEFKSINSTLSTETYSALVKGDLNATDLVNYFDRGLGAYLKSTELAGDGILYTVVVFTD